MSIALAAMADTLRRSRASAGVPLEVLHRIAAMASGGMDTLPHNGAVITLLAVTGLTHKRSLSRHLRNHAYQNRRRSGGNRRVLSHGCLLNGDNQKANIRPDFGDASHATSTRLETRTKVRGLVKRCGPSAARAR